MKFLEGWDVRVTSSSKLEYGGDRDNAHTGFFNEFSALRVSVDNAELYLTRSMRPWRRFAVCECLYSSLKLNLYMKQA